MITMPVPGTRRERAAVASAILSAAGNMLESFGSDPHSGYHDDLAGMPWEHVAVITADLLRNLPGNSWDNRIPQPTGRPDRSNEEILADTQQEV